MGHHHHHHHLLSFHLPHLGLGGGGKKEEEHEGVVRLPPPPPPKGWMAVRVGQEGEEQQRFVVPVVYLNHPLFLRLLKAAEDEYGFEYQKGAITIPCHVEHFRQVQGIIHRDTAAGRGPHHHHNHHNHHLIYGCFRA